jgi:hypothetical protein
MSASVTVGSAAPEFTYTGADGATHRLSELWAERPALVLWLRHFG